MKKKYLYVTPLCKETLLTGAFVMCGSPGLGESEDIEYEDWVVPEWS